MTTFVSYQEFAEMLEAIAIRCNHKQPLSEKVVELYYETVAMKRDAATIRASFTAVFEQWSEYRLPSPAEWLSYTRPSQNAAAYQVVSEPSKAIAALPSASREQHPQVRRRNKIAMIAGIYRQQGDTATYRDMLESRGLLGALMGQITGDCDRITHQDVLAFIESQIASGISHGDLW